MGFADHTWRVQYLPATPKVVPYLLQTSAMPWIHNSCLHQIYAAACAQGVMLVRGPGVMKGYYADETATAKRLCGRWLVRHRRPGLAGPLCAPQLHNVCP